MMRLLITAATDTEIDKIMSELSQERNASYNNDVDFLITGVGGIATTYRLVKKIHEKRPDLVIQAGIAAAFNQEFRPGSVVIVKEEIFGDLGAEENREFKDLFDLGLVEENGFPFRTRMLRNDFVERFSNPGLQAVRGISINEITTRTERIQLLREKFSPDIESMEGAALHYVCLQEEIDFLQIRAISNNVGERNKEKWNIPLAVKNLTAQVASIVKYLDNTHPAVP